MKDMEEARTTQLNCYQISGPQKIHVQKYFNSLVKRIYSLRGEKNDVLPLKKCQYYQSSNKVNRYTLKNKCGISLYMFSERGGVGRRIGRDNLPPD